MSPVSLLLEANVKAEFGDGESMVLGQQPWPSLIGLYHFASCKPNSEASLPSLSTSAHSKSGLESWGLVCLNLLLGPKNGK